MHTPRSYYTPHLRKLNEKQLRSLFTEFAPLTITDRLAHSVRRASERDRALWMPSESGVSMLASPRAQSAPKPLRKLVPERQDDDEAYLYGPAATPREQRAGEQPPKGVGNLTRLFEA